MKARHPPLGAPRSILVLKPSSFGDIIHTLPAVARLRACWPQSKISWLVNPEWSPLLRGNPLVDEVVIFPREDFRGWRGIFRFRGWLRERMAGLRPDLTLDFQGLLRTALVGRAVQAGKLVGMSDAREGARWFYDESVPVPPGVPHAVERYLALSDSIIAAAGCIPPQPSNALPQFPLPPGDPVASVEPVKSSYILLHPFARGAGKSLTVTQVNAICARLSPRRIVVVGKWPGTAAGLPSNALNLLNETSILQLLWLVRHAAFVISVDSGPAHLAAALHKPLVAVHFWSDPRRVGPYSAGAWVVKSGELLQVSELRGRGERFFSTRSGSMLPPAQIEAICRLATSFSDSCA